MREDLLAQMLRNLTDKEDAPPQDDNTLIQKMIAPNETVQIDDSSLAFTKRTIANFVWGGYVGATFYDPNWLWNQGQWK